MPERYAKLAEDWLMRGWSDIDFAIANRRANDLRPTDKRLAHVIRHCDGHTNFNSLLFLPVHIKILEKLIEENIVETCITKDTIADDQGFRKADNPYIRSVHWSVTGRCNMNCRHCYIQAPGKRYNDMTDKQLLHVMDQLERANVLGVSITGGEPFVRKDIFDIIRELICRNIRVHQIYSNGLLVSDAVLEKIIDLGLAPGFSISFDGVGLHDRMRGVKGSEKQVLGAIERIQSTGFKLNVTTCFDQFDISNLEKTYELLNALKINSWEVSQPNKTGNWRNHKMNVSHEKEVILYSHLLGRWYKDDKPFHLQLGALFNSRIDAVGNHRPRFNNRYTPDSFDCGVCRLSPYLLPDGTLLPCHGFTGTGIHKEMPNLLTKDLSEIWTQSRLRDISQAKKKQRLASNPDCADCDLFEHCGMGCRACAFIETGNLESKDVLTCDIWKNGHKQRLLESLICCRR